MISIIIQNFTDDNEELFFNKVKQFYIIKQDDITEDDIYF
jgi:hypothetical protein